MEASLPLEGGALRRQSAGVLPARGRTEVAIPGDVERLGAQEYFLAAIAAGFHRPIDQVARFARLGDPVFLRVASLEVRQERWIGMQSFGLGVPHEDRGIR